MRHRRSRRWIYVLLVILFLMSLPFFYVEKARGMIASLLTPAWKQITPHQESLQVELDALRLQNRLLEEEIFELRDHLNLVGEAPAHSITAPVIYRSPTSWNSTLWIGAGQRDNLVKEREIIAKNSPVLSGGAVIGLVDYVGENQSRVRLITDSALHPSVRVMRQDAQGVIHYLAKGELHGSGNPLWRSPGKTLRGIGFNYDFEDNEGPARDLRTGQTIGKNHSSLQPLPLVQVGDILVTTGLDGVFPRGLPVATITRIAPLREGDYFYELEAIPSATNLQDLSLVHILPSLGNHNFE